MKTGDYVYYSTSEGTLPAVVVSVKKMVKIFGDTLEYPNPFWVRKESLILQSESD